MISRHIRLEIRFSPRTSVKLRSQLHHWCIKVYIKAKRKHRKQKTLQVCLVHLLSDTIVISMISPKIKLRTFLICWFVSKENTGKQMLMKRLMDFSKYIIH